MHMADALISPAVGGSLWACAAGLTGYAARVVKRARDTALAPLMGVLGAFVFAAQMINVAIPGTGASGHLSGGLLLAVLLGPCPAFLTIVSVLVVQALLFADGGLLALGCNIVNMGFFSCFIAYPLIYKPLVGDQPSPVRRALVVTLASVVSLQLGALGVVLETMASGISALPFTAFALLMQPIHLAIGLMEGIVTAAVLTVILQARPDVLARAEATPRLPLRRLAATIAVVALLIGGTATYMASEHPDGLEWAIERLTGHKELPASEGNVHKTLSALQEKTALMPDYAASALPEGLAGVLGGGITLLLALGLGFVLRRRAHTGMGSAADVCNAPG